MNLEAWIAENPDWRPYVDLVVYPPLAEELMKEFTDVSSEVLARCMEYVQEGGGQVTRGTIYVRVRREDKREAGDKWATMLCLNAPPGINTTDTFWAGRKTWVQVFGEEYAGTIKGKLARKGINLKAGDEYMPELARFPGDPEAVVPFGGARSYIRGLCERRGWAAEGAVSTKHREPEDDLLADRNCVPIGEDIIRRKGRMMAQKEPEIFKGKKKQEAREMILERFGPSKVAPKPLP